MHKLMIPVAAGIALFMGAAQAQVQKMQPQQDKMALCDKAAGNKKGSDRKAFVNACMTGQSVGAQGLAAQGLMARDDARSIKASGCEHASRAEDL